MSKICIIMDYGHRLTTPGKRTVPLPRVIHERTMNEGYGSVAANLFRKAGCEVLEVAPDKNASMNENTDLNQRIAKANSWANMQGGQSHYISCHANAGGGQGAEVWIWSGSKSGGKEERAAKLVLEKLCAATGMKNRGVKRGYVGNPKSDFAVNRDTNMPSMLIECGFMDYVPEASKMDNPDFWNICGTAVYEGMAEFLGLDKNVQSPATENKLYTVKFGECTEGDRDSGMNLANTLNLQFKVFVAGKASNGATLYNIEFYPVSEGDKNTIEELGEKLGVKVSS